MKKHDLYDKFLTDTLSENEEKELLEVLKDEKKADSFTEYIIETNMMVSAAENIDSATIQISKSKSEIRSIVLIAAAMITLGFILFFTSFKDSFEVISSDVVNVTEGSEFIDKRIEFTEGEITLRSSNGDHIKVKGPVDLELSSLEEINLRKGVISVKLSDSTDSFEVLTPHGSVKDLGTAFGLAVRESFSEIHVYDGKVQVNLPNAIETLIAGESIAFSPSKKFSSIAYNKNLFKEELAETLFMGERELRPGEQMDLVLDTSGKILKADLKLEFSKEQDFKYRIIAYSNEKEVFKSKEFSANDKPSIEIPTTAIKDLKIEMKVAHGLAANSILKIENMSLITEGVRPYEGEVLIAAGSEWKYIFETKPDKNWMEQNFDSSTWLQGNAVLGFGDKDISTKIGGYELRKTVKNIYFRHEFEVNDLEINSLKKMVANLLADDGALVFLNGSEIFRYNLPDGLIDEDTHALKVISKGGEMIYKNFSIPTDSLKMGKNVLSVVLFQRRGKSSDMRFDLQIKAY